jgi:hypothetical protein
LIKGLKIKVLFNFHEIVGNNRGKD